MIRRSLRYVHQSPENHNGPGNGDARQSLVDEKIGLMESVYVEDHITRTLIDIFDVMILFFNVKHNMSNDIDRVHSNIMPKAPKDKRSKHWASKEEPWALVYLDFLIS